MTVSTVPACSLSSGWMELEMLAVLEVAVPPSPIGRPDRSASPAERSCERGGGEGKVLAG